LGQGGIHRRGVFVRQLFDGGEKAFGEFDVHG
jgi:hypothetical protein